MNNLYHADNLEIMQSIQADSVDLIYADPPFNSGKDYAVPATTDAQGTTAFADTWHTKREQDKIIQMLTDAAAQNPSSKSINALKFIYGLDTLLQTDNKHAVSLKAYLIFMAPRIVEMHRILKDTGAIYLHCDMSANSYLRVLMDSIFDPKQYKEIVWQRHHGHRDTLWGKVHDTILYYGQPDPQVYVQAIMPYTPEYIEDNYPYQDKRGRYATTGNLLPFKTKTHDPERDRQREWKGYKPQYAKGTWSRWSVPRRSKYAKEYIEKHIPGYCDIECPFARLDALDDADFIHWCNTGRPYYKVYYYESRGHIPQSVFSDIKNLSGTGSEINNYPTQKPYALLQRIIQASTRKDDVVLDPFCGSGTTLAVATALERKWIGIDIGISAIETTAKRLATQHGALADREYVLVNTQEMSIALPTKDDVADIQPNLF